MSTSNLLIRQITTLLYNNVGRLNNFGLFDGKMGSSIYFSYYAKKTENNIYKDFSESLIEEVCEEIHLASSLDFSWGLPGIGWSFDYLSQNDLVQIDAEEALIQFDDFIYKHLSDVSKKPNVFIQLLGFAAYFVQRIKSSKASLDKVNTQRLLVIVNLLGKEIKKSVDFIEEPKQWHILWTLPILVYLLSECKNEDVLKNDISKITLLLIDSLTKNDDINLHSNKLLLLWSASCINETIEELTQLKNLIIEKSRDIDRKKIELELPTKDYTLAQGTSGISWLYNKLYKNTGNKKYKLEADFWLKSTLDMGKGIVLVDFIKKSPETSYGFLSGLSGIGFVLLDTLLEDE